MFDATPGMPEGQTIQIVKSPRWVRVMFNGEVIADSKRVLLLRERRHMPVYYFPAADVRQEFLTPTEHRSMCPLKGEASYFSVKAGDRVSENAVWTYQDPLAQCQAIKGYRAFYWDKVDHWYEEEEEIFKHPRDPFKRVDAIASSRHVQVFLEGEPIAESRRPVLVFETGLPTRYYLPQEDVRMELLTPSESHSVCPYKGVASYWNATAAGKLHEDACWGYLDPLPEMPRIRGLLSFYPERVDRVIVDGNDLAKDGSMHSSTVRGTPAATPRGGSAV